MPVCKSYDRCPVHLCFSIRSICGRSGHRSEWCESDCNQVGPCLVTSIASVSFCGVQPHLLLVHLSTLLLSHEEDAFLRGLHPRTYNCSRKGLAMERLFFCDSPRLAYTLHSPDTRLRRRDFLVWKFPLKRVKARTCGGISRTHLWISQFCLGNETIESRQIMPREFSDSRARLSPALLLGIFRIREA